MRAAWSLVISGLVLAACFEEGGDDARNQAALTTAEGLIAFRDIHNNLTTDPVLAGEALLEFVKTPVAADNLISPPFDLGVMNAARLEPIEPGEIPACLQTSGPPGCDEFNTIETCDAGGFSFEGRARRKCSPCEAVEGVCRYNWLFNRLTFTSALLTLNTATWGSWSGSATSVQPHIAWNYDLAVEASDKGGARRAGNLAICACGPLTVQESMTESRKPRKLVNSSFVVRATVPAGQLERCAFVQFDGSGNPSVGNSCECPDGVTCIPPAIPDGY